MTTYPSSDVTTNCAPTKEPEKKEEEGKRERKRRERDREEEEWEKEGERERRRERKEEKEDESDAEKERVRRRVRRDVINRGLRNMTDQEIKFNDSNHYDCIYDIYIYRILPTYDFYKISVKTFSRLNMDE